MAAPEGAATRQKIELLGRHQSTAPAQKIQRLAKPKARDFAAQMAAAEFGGRYWGWREWDTFTDRAPDDEPPTVWGPR